MKLSIAKLRPVLAALAALAAFHSIAAADQRVGKGDNGGTVQTLYLTFDDDGVTVLRMTGAAPAIGLRSTDWGWSPSRPSTGTCL